MKAVFTEPFLENFKKMPDIIKRKFEKQLDFLLQDIRYSSLRAKKYDESRNIWQARVDENYRFYFQIKSDTYWMLNIKKHPK